MRKFIHLVIRTIFYDKRQSAAIFFSIIISASLLSGIGTLIHCGVQQNYEKRKEIYGDWHLAVPMELEWATQIKGENRNDGLCLAGICQIVKMIDEPQKITYEYMDEQCLEMLGIQVKKGTYPKNKTEIALDEYAITNLGLTDVIGEKVIISDEEYILSGIVENQNLSGEEMHIFVSNDYINSQRNVILYTKFEENNVYKQINDFINDYHIDDKTIDINDEIVDYVGGISFVEVSEIIKEGLSMPNGKAGFILGTLRERCHLLERGILFVIGIFCGFVIYSIFQISAMKRIPQFGIMYAIGIERKNIFSLLFGELFFLFVVGYPIGSLLGIAIVKTLFGHIGNIFVDQKIGDFQAGVHISKADQFLLYSDKSQSVFSVSVKEIVLGAILMLILFVVISLLLMYKVEKMTIVQAMKNQNVSRKRNRKIYAKTKQYLPNVLTRKFIFENKTSCIAIIISIAIAGIVYLSGSFIIYNTKLNNELSLKTDDGLGSDLQIYEASENLNDMIENDLIKNIEEISGVEAVHAVSYTLGELFLEKQQVLWDSYIPELANDPSWMPDKMIMEKYNGLGLRDDNGDYRLKTNVYGYDKKMIDALAEYVIEGSVNYQSLKQDNSVILKTWVDGQGNTTGIDVHPGDTISLKVAKLGCNDTEILKFLGDESEYIEKQYVVSAIVSRPMARNTSFIGDDGKSSLDIIMTNEQMERNYNINGYNMACVQLQSSIKNTSSVTKEIANNIVDIKNCVLKDYTQAIATHNQYLNQRKVFYLCLTVILLLVSMFYMANSMNFLLHTRRYDIGVLRAMGITEERFLVMMAKEAGIYGIAASVVTIVVFIPIRNLLFFFMKSVWLYIMPIKVEMMNELIFISLMNILICIVSIVIPVRTMLKEDIISEIKI